MQANGYSSRHCEEQAQRVTRQSMTRSVIARSECNERRGNPFFLKAFKNWIATQNKQRFARDDGGGAMTRMRKILEYFVHVLLLTGCFLMVSVSAGRLDDAFTSSISQYNKEKREKDSDDFVKKQKKLQDEQEKEKEALDASSKNKDGIDGNTEKGKATTQNLFTDAKYETFAPQDDIKLGNF